MRSLYLTIATIVVTSMVAVSCGGDSDDDSSDSGSGSGSGSGSDSGGVATNTPAPPAFGDRAATPDVGALRTVVPPLPPTATPTPATEGTLTGGSGRSDINVTKADGSVVTFSISGSRTALTGVERDNIADGMYVIVEGAPGEEATSLAAATVGTTGGGSGRDAVNVTTADGTVATFDISGSRSDLVGVERDSIADGMNVAVFDDGNSPAEATKLIVLP